MGHSRIALARKILSAFVLVAAVPDVAVAAPPDIKPHYYKILHRLTTDEGVWVSGNLVLGPDGNLFGVARRGGSSADCGTLFRMTPAGVFTKLVTFDGANGCHPTGTLAVGNDGNFYGTTTGQIGSGIGTVFRLTPAGAFAQLSSSPTFFEGPLTRASDGNFYSIASTQTGGHGIYRVTTSGLVSKLAGLTGNSAAPVIIQASDGSLYGIGGQVPPNAGLVGQVFRVTLSGVITYLANIPGSSHGSGWGPGFTDGGDGYLYLTVDSLMRIKLGGNQVEGVAPFEGGTSLLIKAPDGNFYGEIDRGFVDDGASHAIMKANVDGTSSAAVYLSGGAGSLMQTPDGYFYGISNDAIYRAHRPTKLIAKGVITLAPVAGKLAFNPEAVLTDAMSGAPVRGGLVTFFGGGTFLCSGYTDSAGVAKCQAKLVDHVKEVLNLGYHAFFGDDGDNLPSDSKGALICVGTVCAPPALPKVTTP